MLDCFKTKLYQISEQETLGVNAKTEYKTTSWHMLALQKCCGFLCPDIAQLLQLHLNHHHHQQQQRHTGEADLKCPDILSVQLELQEIITGHIPLFLEELFKVHSSPSISAVQSWAPKISAEIFQDDEKYQMIICWQLNFY